MKLGEIFKYENLARYRNNKVSCNRYFFTISIGNFNDELYIISDLYIKTENIYGDYKFH